MREKLHIIRKLFSRKDKGKFLLITLMMAFSGIMEMIGIGLLAGTIALFIDPESQYAKQYFEYACRFFPGMSWNTFVISAIAIIALLMLLKNGVALLIIAIQSKFLRTKQNMISHRYFEMLLKSDYRAYIDRSTDEYNGAIERIKRLFDNFFQPALQLISDLIVILALVMITIFLLPWSATLIMALMVGAMYSIHRAFQRINRRTGEAHYLKEVAENKLRLNVLLGMEQIKVSGAEDYFSSEYQKANSAICSRSATLYTLGQIPRLSLESLAVLLVCAIFILLLNANVHQDKIILTFTIIIAAMARILPALSRAHYNLTQLKQNAVLLNEFSANYFQLRSEPEPAESAVIPDGSKDIVLKDVTFFYQENTPVIKNLNCTFPARQITGIAGRSGIGKTTLINLLCGLFTPVCGNVFAGGTDISLDLPGWRAQIGVVPQNVFIFDGSVRENIALGIPETEADEKKIAAALIAAQIPELAETPKKMLNSRSGLSGGQRQRIGIARALYRDPEVLILDEATNALDEQTESDLLNVLKSLRGRVTVIVISHRQETLAICDKIVSL